MTYPHRPVGLVPVLRAKAELSRPWTVRPNGRPARTLPLTRRYETAWLAPDGSLAEATRLGPAMPAFESAFAAFARGTLISTPSGPVAVEDLAPGMTLVTRQGPQVVRWMGRVLLPPPNMRQDGGADLFRLSAESFSPGRPLPDLVLGSAARLVHRAPRLVGSRLGPDVLVPVADFADGINVMAITPMSAVWAFHIVLDRHAVIEANGLPVESFHPGREVAEALQGDLAKLFLSFFPHLAGLAEFGPACLPRLGLARLAELTEI